MTTEREKEALCVISYYIDRNENLKTAKEKIINTDELFTFFLNNLWVLEQFQKIHELSLRKLEEFAQMNSYGNDLYKKYYYSIKDKKNYLNMRFDEENSEPSQKDIPDKDVEMEDINHSDNMLIDELSFESITECSDTEETEESDENSSDTECNEKDDKDSETEESDENSDTEEELENKKNIKKNNRQVENIVNHRYNLRNRK